MGQPTLTLRSLPAKKKKESTLKNKTKQEHDQNSQLERERSRKNSKTMALSSRPRLLLVAAVAALLALMALAPVALAANTLMAVDLGGEFMKVRRKFFLLFPCWAIESVDRDRSQAFLSSRVMAFFSATRRCLQSFFCAQFW